MHGHRSTSQPFTDQWPSQRSSFLRAATSIFRQRMAARRCISLLAAATKQLIEARCNMNIPNVDGITALHAAQRMGHTAIATLIRNTRQKNAKSVARQAEEERSSTTTGRLVRVLESVPEEDWCRTWAACRTIMLRRTSKSVKEQVDKMRLPAVVCLCELWRDGINRSPAGGGRPNKMENVQIVMNQLPLMTAWCRITKLKLHVLYPTDFDALQECWRKSSDSPQDRSRILISTAIALDRTVSDVWQECCHSVQRSGTSVSPPMPLTTTGLTLWSESCVSAQRWRSLISCAMTLGATGRAASYECSSFVQR